MYAGVSLGREMGMRLDQDFLDADRKLLDWCPYMYVADPDQLCASVGAFLEFLADTGRLAGGPERAAQLGRLATRTVPVLRAMGDPAAYRAAKAVFKHPMANPPGVPSYAELLAQDTMSEKELEAELEFRIIKYHELPERKRDQLTAEFHTEEDALAARFLVADAKEKVELPFVYIPPPPADVEALAAGAPLLQKIDTHSRQGQSRKPCRRDADPATCARIAAAAASPSPVRIATTIASCCSSECAMLRGSNGIWSSRPFSRIRFSATSGTSDGDPAASAIARCSRESSRR